MYIKVKTKSALPLTASSTQLYFYNLDIQPYHRVFHKFDIPDITPTIRKRTLNHYNYYYYRFTVHFVVQWWCHRTIRNSEVNSLLSILLYNDDVTELLAIQKWIVYNHSAVPVSSMTCEACNHSAVPVSSMWS